MVPPWAPGLAGREDAVVVRREVLDVAVHVFNDVFGDLDGGKGVLQPPLGSTNRATMLAFNTIVQVFRGNRDRFRPAAGALKDHFPSIFVPV
jgi:hypothetical protein